MRSTPPTGFPKQHVPTLPMMGFPNESPSSEPLPARAAWENDHFILTDNRNYPNVRMRMKE
eukprot:4204593-Lingulodinium_polyedra.AAC.1